jgi:hypothetical protein
VVELPKPFASDGQLEGEMQKIRDEDVQGAIGRILARRGLGTVEEV